MRRCVRNRAHRELLPRHKSPFDDQAEHKSLLEGMISVTLTDMIAGAYWVAASSTQVRSRRDDPCHMRQVDWRGTPDRCFLKQTPPLDIEVGRESLLDWIPRRSSVAYEIGITGRCFRNAGHFSPARPSASRFSTGLNGGVMLCTNSRPHAAFSSMQVCVADRGIPVIWSEVIGGARQVAASSMLVPYCRPGRAKVSSLADDPRHPDRREGGILDSLPSRRDDPCHSDWRSKTGRSLLSASPFSTG